MIIMMKNTRRVKLILIKWRLSSYRIQSGLNSCYYSWVCSQIFVCFQKYANEANGSIQCQISLCTSASSPKRNCPLSPIFSGGGRWRMWHRLCQIDPFALFACQTADICNLWPEKKVQKFKISQFCSFLICSQIFSIVININATTCAMWQILTSFWKINFR